MDDQPDHGKQARQRRHPGYGQDFYGWAMGQAALLRSGRIAEADVLNIAEEIEDVGKSEYYRLESAVRVILIHLLKWDYQPERRSRSWRSSVLVQRHHAQDVLEDNPGLKPMLPRAIERAYHDARIEAASEMERDESSIPECCPYSRDQIVERPIAWPPTD